MGLDKHQLHALPRTQFGHTPPSLSLPCSAGPVQQLLQMNEDWMFDISKPTPIPHSEMEQSVSPIQPPAEELRASREDSLPLTMEERRPSLFRNRLPPLAHTSEGAVVAGTGPERQA